MRSRIDHQIRNSFAFFDYVCIPTVNVVVCIQHIIKTCLWTNQKFSWIILCRHSSSLDYVLWTKEIAYRQQKIPACVCVLIKVKNKKRADTNTHHTNTPREWQLPVKQWALKKFMIDITLATLISFTMTFIQLIFITSCTIPKKPELYCVRCSSVRVTLYITS